MAMQGGAGVHPPAQWAQAVAPERLLLDRIWDRPIPPGQGGPPHGAPNTQAPGPAQIAQGARTPRRTRRRRPTKDELG